MKPLTMILIVAFTVSCSTEQAIEEKATPQEVLYKVRKAAMLANLKSLIV